MVGHEKGRSGGVACEGSTSHVQKRNQPSQSWGLIQCLFVYVLFEYHIDIFHNDS